MTNDQVINLSAVGHQLRRRWRLLVALAIVGALLGLIIALIVPPRFSGVTRVLIQGVSEPEAVVAETQIATSLIVMDRAAAQLDRGTGGAYLRNSVAVRVADGYVLEIQATGPTPAAAAQASTAVTEQYIRFSGEIAADAAGQVNLLLGQLRGVLDVQAVDVGDRIALLQAADAATGAAPGEELGRLQTQLAELTDGVEAVDAILNETGTGAREGLSVIEPAVESTDPIAPTPVHLVGGGAVSMVGLGALFTVLARRRDDRLERNTDMAAALGAPVVGNVAIARGQGSDDAAERAARRRWTRLRHLLREDPRWDPGSSTTGMHGISTDEGYRRLVERLGAGVDPTVPPLVVVPADDTVGRLAVGGLARAAAATGRSVSVLTDSPVLQAVIDAAIGGASQHATDGEPPGQAHGGVLAGGIAPILIAEVVPARPIVPRCGPTTGAVVVAGSATRTGWELVALGQACDMSGHPVIGVIVASPDSNRSDDAPPPTAVVPPAVRGQLNGVAAPGGTP